MEQQIFLVVLLEWFEKYFGGFDGLLKGLMSIGAFSCVTGVIRTIVEKNKISSVCFKWVLRYFLIFIMVGIGTIFDSQILGEAGVLRITIITFYIGNEGLQLLNNVAYLGLPIPKQLRILLHQLNDDRENTNNE